MHSLHFLVEGVLAVGATCSSVSPLLTVPIVLATGRVGGVEESEGGFEVSEAQLVLLEEALALCRGRARLLAGE